VTHKVRHDAQRPFGQVVEHRLLERLLERPMRQVVPVQFLLWPLVPLNNLVWSACAGANGSCSVAGPPHSIRLQASVPVGDACVIAACI